MNSFKTFILMFGLFVVFTLVGQVLGGRQGMVIAFRFAMVTNFIGYYFSDRIVLAMYGAKEVTREQAPQIFRPVRNLTQKMGIPMPKLYVIPSDSPNAFATGRNPQHASVCFTESILQILNDDELEAVIGHELSHVLHRDILIGTLAATMAAAIMMLARMAMWAQIFGGGRRSDNDRGGDAISMLLMFVLALVAAPLIQMAISRSREYAADEGSATITGKPLALASALEKIAAGVKQVPMEVSSPATSHLFIMSPGRESFILQLFSTHPSPGRRIQRLEKMAESMGQGILIRGKK